MLTKSINLNLKMVKSEIELSICAAVLSMILLALPIGAFALLIGLAVIFGMFFKGYSKIFGSSLFGEESAAYMTLPIPTQVLIQSKLAAGVIWAMALGATFAAGMSIVLLMSGGVGAFDELQNTLGGSLYDLGLSPVETGIYMGLMPFNLCLGAGLCGLIILSLQVYAHLNTHSRLAPRLNNASPGKLTVLALAVYYICGMVIKQLEDFIAGSGIRYFILFLIELVIRIVIAAILYRYCQKALEQGTAARG